jgi:hypothetical protein
MDWHYVWRPPAAAPSLGTDERAAVATLGQPLDPRFERHFLGLRSDLFFGQQFPFRQAFDEVPSRS